MALHGLILALGLLVGSSVTAHAEPLDEPLKPLPPVPALDPKRVQLGLRLFNDPRLSVNNTLSCASCHHLDKGGADDKPFSLGFDGKPVEVNTPTVFNAGLNFHQFWDGRVETLEEQVHFVVISPTEMANTWESVVKRIADDPGYSKDFKAAYPDGVNEPNIRSALADYERTLQTPNSRFDQYLQGNTDILTPREKFGYQRFKEYGCIACHQGVNIGGNMFQKFGVMGDYIKDRGNPTRADEGRYNITGDEADRQVFKVPSLRNVAVTAPYFHDASAPTLEHAVEVMFKYQLGREPLKNDTTLIVEFLKTLTGESEGKPL
ncbi:cytochrome c peroxidase [Pseudomonas sp. P9_35]|uniref:cytochrome-c peroxidase n=1 Tax=unclassified Pseudomonas TaxID=196821 RepID=UPI002A363503|nr:MULTISPECIES: cytochrome c peroxidase [unclassified Pseudomonas]WPN62401.1 cytochrome c peroxidase [Pseudomonas sp. P9_32]WPN68155.1 cytochrome c peroxidase [Pseudomonas sp. P9_35]